MNADTQPAADDQQQPDPPARSPGRMLRDARIAADLAHGEVANRLNLTGTVILALERDATAELPSPVFVRGYIKNYARMLGLPADEMVALYDSQRVPEEATVELRSRVPLRVPGRRNPLMKALPLLLVIGAIAAAAYWLANRTDGNGWLDPAGLINGLLPAGEPASPSIELPPVGRPTAPDDTTAPAPAAPPATVALPTPPAGGAQTAAETPAAPPPPAAETVAPDPRDRVSLRVRFDSWVEITDSAGERLVFDILASGTSRQVRGVGPFTVLLGRANAVDIVLNGVAVDHVPYQRKGIARFIVEAKDGEIVTRNP